MSTFRASSNASWKCITFNKPQKDRHCINGGTYSFFTVIMMLGQKNPAWNFIYEADILLFSNIHLGIHWQWNLYWKVVVGITSRLLQTVSRIAPMQTTPLNITGEKVSCFNKKLNVGFTSAFFEEWKLTEWVSVMIAECDVYINLRSKREH